MFTLFNAIFGIAASIIDSFLGLKFDDLGSYGILSSIYGLATFIPGIAVGVRRLHDVGKSGWFYFIILIPIVGAIWLLVLFATDGTPGTNEYGVNPKEDYNEINEIGAKEF